MKKVEVVFTNPVEELPLEKICDLTLTNFNKKQFVISRYYNFNAYTIRLSNHLAKNSDGNIQIVELDDKILFWKIGVLKTNSSKDDEQGTFIKLLTKNELFEILTMINNSVKYFIP